MPLFDFKCRACGAEFETLVMGSDKPLCPSCKSADLEKLMSTFAFRSGGGGGQSADTATSSGSKCSGCAGRSCGTCH